MIVDEERFKIGTRVELVPYPDEDERPIERGTIVGVDTENEAVEVLIDFAYRKDGDDGRRTVVYDELAATGNTQDIDENAVIMREL